MRRDMELARIILLDISKSDKTIELNSLDQEDKLYSYHIDILKQANLITYKYKWEDYAERIIVDEPQLTWEGNDYLDTIYTDNMWDSTKKDIKRKGLELSNVPFDVLKEFAKLQVKKLMGMD